MVYSTAHSDETYSGSDRVANVGGEETTFQRTAFAVDYRWSEQLRGTLLVPHLIVEREVGGALAERLSGLSDVTALVEWRPDVDGAWTFIGGLQLPTGEDKENPAPGVVPPSLLQLGSGTWDPIAGVRWNGSWGGTDTWMSATTLIPLGESDAGLEPGLVVQLSAGAAWSLGESLRVSLAVDDTIRESDTLDGTTLANTSASIYSVMPGVSWRFAERWALSARARVPIYYDLDGTQLAPGPLFEFAVDWVP